MESLKYIIPNWKRNNRKHPAVNINGFILNRQIQDINAIQTFGKSNTMDIIVITWHAKSPDVLIVKDNTYIWMYLQKNGIKITRKRFLDSIQM